MPLHNYGQREHLVLIAALPYAFLLAARARGFRPDPRLVVAVSTAAALGFALKHYFVLMPALGELWLLFRLKRNYQPVRAETAVLVGLAALYGGAVALWAKPFLTNIVPLVRLAYGGYESPFIEQVNKPEQVVWLMAALCFARYGRPKNPDARNLAEILLISAGAFVFAYFAQQKGWPYHAIPATGMAVAAVFSAMILPLSGDRRLGRSLLPMVTCVLPLFLGAAEGPYANGNARSFNSAVHGMAPGSTFLAITTRPSWTWPMIESDKLLWPSRYFAFWMFDSIGVDEASDHADPAMRQLGEEVVRNTAEDMRCNPPQRVLVEGVPTNSGLRSVNFRMLPFFEHDAEFVEIMRHYRRTEHSPVYDLFELASPYGREKGDRCRDIA
jgi:hypothetical protein